MAPKAPSRSREPSKEKPEKEEPPSEEEEEEEEEEESEEEEDPSEDEGGKFSDEEEEESSEHEDQDQEKVKSSKNPNPVSKFDSKFVVQENGSETEPESDGSPHGYKLQPILKSPVASTKRAHEESGENEHTLKSCKKSRIEEKKSSSTPGGGGAVGCITRLWSNEDEIAVLNGMISFRNVKGLDPNADMGAFYNFIKGKLQVDFSRDQLRTKISRMKKRFLNALKRGENGSDPVFSKPHEDMAFELSKKIWGGVVGSSGGIKNGAANSIHENGEKDIVKTEKIEKEIVKKEKDCEGDFWSRYPFFSASFHSIAGNFPSLAMSEAGMSFMKEKLSLIGNLKAKELDEKWKQLILQETELNHKMLSLMTEQVKLAFDE